MSLTKKDLSQIGSLVSTSINKAMNNQLKAFDGLLKHDLQPIKDELTDIRSTLNIHTTILDAHSKSLEILKTEVGAVKYRVGVHGKWFQQIAGKININLIKE